MFNQGRLIRDGYLFLPFIPLILQDAMCHILYSIPYPGAKEAGCSTLAQIRTIHSPAIERTDSHLRGLKKQKNLTPD